jgi:hypothetical protein
MIPNVIVSYVPLLWPDQMDDIENIMESNIGNVKGCAWYQEDGEFKAVLLADKAEEIASHLKYWSESEPEKWFKFKWNQKGTEYRFILMPELEKTIERFKIKFQLDTGFPFPERNQFKLIFLPLSFSAKREHLTLNQKRIHIKICDTKVMNDNSTPDIWDISDDLGTFEVVQDDSLGMN